MIDKVLGFDQPAPRRRRTDNQSEISSKQESNTLPTASPVKSAIKKPSTQQVTLPQPKKVQEIVDQPQEVPPPVVQPKQKIARTKSPRHQAKLEPPKNQSEEQVPSPAVRNLGIAKVPKNIEQMRNSGKFKPKQSIKLEAQKTGTSDDTMYKLKLIAFLIISVLMTIYAMTPARKTTSRRK